MFVNLDNLSKYTTGMYYIGWAVIYYSLEIMDLIFSRTREKLINTDENILLFS